MKFKEFIKENWFVILIFILAVFFSIFTYIKWNKTGFNWWFVPAGLFWAVFIGLTFKKKN